MEKQNTYETMKQNMVAETRQRYKTAEYWQSFGVETLSEAIALMPESSQKVFRNKLDIVFRKQMEAAETSDHAVSENKLRVLLVEPNQYPKQVEVTNTLEELQRIVGGYIEAVHPSRTDKVCLICNEEGKMLGLPPNRSLRDSKGNVTDTIVGSFLIVGQSGENFCSLTNDQMKEYEQLYHQPEVFFSMRRRTIAVPVADEFVGRNASDLAKAPVYSQSLQTAEAYNQKAEYMVSFRANEECKRRMEKIIRENYDGSRMAPQGAKQILAEYGVRRVEYVLASTIQLKPTEGRFSQDNKIWAGSVFTVSDMQDGRDRRMDYAVQTHPSVLDSFVSQVRQEIKAMEQAKPLSLKERLDDAKTAVAKQDAVKTASAKKQEQSL